MVFAGVIPIYLNPTNRILGQISFGVYIECRIDEDSAYSGVPL